jgi:D-lyxose ketol-isomerase
MRRSEINQIIRDTDEFLRERRFLLPPFAYWTPDAWWAKGPEVREIVDRRLGWDITDFGRGDFERVGLLLFTLRNGAPENLQHGRGKIYAEKILVAGVDQVTPLHFHWVKTEDIINRGGGRLVVQLYNSTPSDDLGSSDVVVSIDGVQRTVPAGGTCILDEGESITLAPRCYHSFWAAEGRVLAGEVSVVNDDARDNRFYEPVGRFPEIEEDEPPLHLLVGDYDGYYQHVSPIGPAAG